MSPVFVVVGLVGLALGLFNVWTFVETGREGAKAQIFERIKDQHPEYADKDIKCAYRVARWGTLAVGVIMIAAFVMMVVGICTGHIHY